MRVWNPSQQWTPACKWFQPSSVACLCYCLPHPYIPAKVDPSWSPLGFCSGWPLVRNAFSSSPSKSYRMAQGQVRCLLLCKTSLIPVRIHHSPLCAPSITLCNTLLHSSTYCIILWLVVYVSDSLARLAPLGLEQCLIQCKSPSVSIGPGTTKMPNTCCGFIIYGPGGHHAGRCKVCGDHIVENVYC